MQTKERRKFMRISTELEGQYWAKGPTMTQGVLKVHDFSREGLGARFNHPLENGEHVDITLRVPGDNVPILATAQVSWSKTVKDQPGVGAGLRLLAIKPLDLARLLDFVYSRWLGVVRKTL